MEERKEAERRHERTSAKVMVAQVALGLPMQFTGSGEGEDNLPSPLSRSCSTSWKRRPWIGDTLARQSPAEI